MPNIKSVQQHLENLQTFDSKNYVIVEAIRQLIFKTFPEAAEIVKYNGLMYKGIGGIFTYKNHASLEFTNGYLMKDEHNQLEGDGKFRRHLKFESVENITTKNLQYYLDQINNLG
jgi:Domain of unknown function (DU1801)